MKRIVKGLLFILVFFSFCFNVEASTYSVKELIPINELATVETDTFTYQDFLYSSSIDSKGNASINFNQIINKTSDTVPVSIGVLLFDGDKKNIGYLTYCTNQDFDSDFNQFKLKAKEGASFSITVSSRYFTTREYVEDNIPKKEKYKPSDVRYIAVMDENKFCKIGGYSNYQDLTIEQINNGQTANDRILLRDIPKQIINIGIPLVVVIVGLTFLVYFIYCSFLDSLHKKMFQKGTILSFLPFTNFYILLKVVFGPVVGIILFLVSFFSSVLIPSLGLIISSSISSISFILAVIKFFTKKYYLFYLAPFPKKGGKSQSSMSASKIKPSVTNNSNNNNNNTNNNNNNINNNNNNINNNINNDNNSNNQNSGNRFVDLSYRDKMNSTFFTDSSDNTISQGGSGVVNQSNQDADQNQSNGESNLSNMFK